MHRKCPTIVEGLQVSVDPISSNVNPSSVIKDLQLTPMTLFVYVWLPEFSKGCKSPSIWTESTDNKRL